MTSEFSMVSLAIPAMVSVLGSVLVAHIMILIYVRLHRVRAPRVGKSPWLSGLNRARADFVKNGWALTRLGYEEYKDSLYWIQTGDMERLVLPHRYIDELRKLPDATLDSRQAVVERNLGWYNGVDVILKSTAHVHICRTQLVQHLDEITRSQVKDLPAIFKTELGDVFENGEFHYFQTSTVLLDIVNRSAAKALVGEPLCHDQRWLNTSLCTTINVGLHCKNLQEYPAVLRPLANHLLKSRKALDESFAEAEKLLTAVVSTRNPRDKNSDILQWLLDSTKASKLSMPFLTNQVLFIAIAATRSTATSVTNTLYDVIEHAQYQDMLREEIGEAVMASGWDLTALQSMKRLDSFIKESQRLNPHLLLSFNRKVQRTVTLSDGLILPAGTFVSTPAYWIARDTKYFPDGETFNPWRWYELREEAEREGRNTTAYLASSTSAENLHWGYGRNACPGRFMAMAEIKLIVAWVLWHFDIRFPPGQDYKPDSIFVDERVLPNPTQKIGLRPRRQCNTTLL